MAESFPNRRPAKVPAVGTPDYFFMPVMYSDAQIIHHALTLAIQRSLVPMDAMRAHAILRTMAVASNPKTAYSKADIPE